MKKKDKSLQNIVLNLNNIALSILGTNQEHIFVYKQVNR